MALTTISVQGSNGVTQTVLVDTITGQTYAIPLYKLSVGAVGTDDGPVSSANPLPVSIASVPSHAVTNAGTFAVQSAQAGTWTVDLGATDNAVLDAIAASVAGTLTVGSHAVTNAGTFATQNTETRPSTATITEVATSTTNATLVALNTSRRGAVIANDSASTLYVKFGTTASATSWTYQVAPGQHLELPFPVYTGRIDGILSSGSGTARVTEMT